MKKKILMYMASTYKLKHYIEDVTELILLDKNNPYYRRFEKQSNKNSKISLNGYRHRS